MSEWLKNPSALFDLRGKVAVVTGASGAFGALASKVLAGAGARLVLAAGNQAALEEMSAQKAIAYNDKDKGANWGWELSRHLQRLSQHAEAVARLLSVGRSR